MSGVGWTGPNAMADPDLQIRRWGGGGSKKTVFLRPFGPQFGQKIKWGGVGHQGPSPGSATEMQLYGTVFLCLVCENEPGVAISKQYLFWK